MLIFDFASVSFARFRKNLPLMNTDDTDRKKPAIKPVSAKAAAKKPAHRGGTETRRAQSNNKSNH